jgi:hypothetical protein
MRSCENFAYHPNWPGWEDIANLSDIRIYLQILNTRNFLPRTRLYEYKNDLDKVMPTAIPAPLAPYVADSLSANTQTLVTSVLSTPPPWLLLRLLYGTLYGVEEDAPGRREQKQIGQQVIFVSLLRPLSLWIEMGKKMVCPYVLCAVCLLVLVLVVSVGVGRISLRHDYCVSLCLCVCVCRSLPLLILGVEKGKEHFQRTRCDLHCPNSSSAFFVFWRNAYQTYDQLNRVLISLLC